MYYFAYGSNLNVEQMRRRCHGAQLIGTAYWEGHRLVFRGSKTGAYLTVIPAEGYSVPIGVWYVDKADLKSLDRYEGYPHFYDRQEIWLQCYRKGLGIRNAPAFRANGKVYVMTGIREPGVPSIQYFEVCRQGYDDFGFPLDPLLLALETVKEEVLNYGA